MGSNWFEVKSREMSAQKAYNKAVEIAKDEYGHQEGYSGQINSTPGFRDATEKFKQSGKSLSQWITERKDKLSKFDGAECICIRKPVTNDNKVKSKVEHIVSPGTKKWVLKYVVSCYDGNISSHNTKGEAVKAARAYTEKNLSSTVISMEKMLEKGNHKVATVVYKRSIKENNGEYLFYGWAND
jgi:hypothetical protein